MPNFDRLNIEELARLRAEKRRELAKIERQEREMEGYLRLLKSVLDDIDRMEDMSWGDLIKFRGKLHKMKELVTNPKLHEGDPPTDDDVASIDQAIELVDTLEFIRNRTDQQVRELFKQHKRDAERRKRAADNNPAQEVRCVVCGKRPRHYTIGGLDYCKRCVPDDQRPKGKVV